MRTDKTPLPLPTLADLEEEVRTLVASGTFRATGKFKGNFGIFESPRTHAEAREIVAKEHGFKTWSALHDYVVSDIAAVDTLVEMGDVVGLSCHRRVGLFAQALAAQGTGSVGRIDEGVIGHPRR
jgi:hypothetical protein